MCGNWRIALGVTLRNVIHLLWDRILHWPRTHPLDYHVSPRDFPVPPSPVCTTAASFMWMLAVQPRFLSFLTKDG